MLHNNLSLFGKKVLFGKSGTYISKYTLIPLLSQNMVHFAWTTKSVCIDILKHIGLKTARWRENKYGSILFFLQSGAYKSKYSLKPLLRQNMVHFAWTTKSVCIYLVAKIGLKVLGKKSTWRSFLKNLALTNQNLPSNLYWAKIWCVLLEQQSHSVWRSFSCSTKLRVLITSFNHP